MPSLVLACRQHIADLDPALKDFVIYAARDAASCLRRCAPAAGLAPGEAAKGVMDDVSKMNNHVECTWRCGRDSGGGFPAGVGP